MGQQEQAEIEQTFKKLHKYVNPALADVFNFMGFGTIEDHALGSLVWDIEGTRFIDCLGGFGVFALGHSHPKVLEAVRDQLGKMPLSSKLMYCKPQADLAEALAEVTPGELQYTFFCNSGTEAVEGALKIARMASGKPQIISTKGAFHGKTLGSLSASGREKYKDPFKPLMPEFVHIPFGDLPALEAAMSDDTAAFIVEPIQGEGGVNVPPADYLPAARELCDKHGALLILDEVQTGFGRTGRMFCADHCGVAPDIMTMGKAIGGGVMPLGAFSATPELWKVFEENPLIHSSTFGGNPLACRAGLATLEVMKEEDLPAQAARKGEWLMSKLRELSSQYPELVVQVRGMGLIIGVEFSQDDIGGLMIAALAQRHILVAYTLNNPTVMRFEPALNMPDELLEEVVTAFAEGLAQTREILASLEM